MRRFLTIAVASVIVSLPTSASADAYSFTTGNTLHEWCDKSFDESESVSYAIHRSLCEGYIMGSFQTIWAASLVKGLKPEECLPSTVTDDQIGDIVKVYLKNHPGERHTLALLMVEDSLQEAFPGCLKL